MQLLSSHSDGPPTNRLSLTFTDGAAEASFLADRKPQVISGLRGFAITLCVVGFFAWAWVMAQLQANHVFLTQVGTLVILHAVAFTLVVLTRDQDKCCLVRTETLECLFIASTMVFQALVVIALDGYYSVKVFGDVRFVLSITEGIYEVNHSFEEGGYYSDSKPLMMLLCTGVATHLLVSLRFSRVIILDIFINLLYIMVGLVYGSPEGLANYVLNVIFLASSTWIVAMGHRRIESLERMRFTSIEAAKRDLVLERVLRYETEFELDRFTTLGRIGRPSAPSESDASANKTNISSALAHPREDIWDLRLEALQALATKEHWWIPRSDLTVDWHRPCGKGGFGSVFSGELHFSAVAVKVAYSPDSDATDGATDELQSQQANALVNEIRILRRIRHPNIITFYGASLDEGNCRLLVIEELAKGQSLRTAVKMSSIVAAPWEASGYGSILLGICAGLSHLHAQQPEIAHGDLKPSNIMLSSDCTPKLVDFGLSRLLSKKRTFAGSTAWAAPEIFQFSTMKNLSADVFSFGCVVYFVATSLIPFREEEQTNPKNVAALPWPRQLSAFQVQCKVLCDLSVVYRPADRSSTRDLMDLIVKMARAMEATRPRLEL